MPLRFKRMFPGPRAYPVIGNPWAITRDPLRALLSLQQTYGDLVEFWIANRHVVFLGDPALVEHLLVRQNLKTIKDPVTRELSAILGNGLVTSDGAHWKKQRKAIAPSFQPRQLEAYGDAMVESALECLPPVGDVDVYDDMARATLHIVIRTIFGAEPSNESREVGPLLERLMGAFVKQQRSFWRFVPSWVPAHHRREVIRARKGMDRVIYKVIERARNDRGKGSLVDRLLVARDEDGGGMTDLELRDELITLFLAGHETTSLLLSFSLMLLAEHPEVQDRVVAELASVADGRRLTNADLRSLPLLDAVLKEALRLYPPVWAIAREVVEPIELEPKGQASRGRLEVGTKVVISMWNLHRDPRYWVGPERFRPDRWLNGETDGLPRMSFLPFSGGARVCVGNHYAMMEAMLVLGTVLQHREVGVSPGYTPVFQASVTLRPVGGVRVVMKERISAGHE